MLITPYVNIAISLYLIAFIHHNQSRVQYTLIERYVADISLLIIFYSSPTRLCCSPCIVEDCFLIIVSMAVIIQVEHHVVQLNQAIHIVIQHVLSQ